MTTLNGEERKERLMAKTPSNINTTTHLFQCSLPMRSKKKQKQKNVRERKTNGGKTKRNVRKPNYQKKRVAKAKRDWKVKGERVSNVSNYENEKVKRLRLYTREKK